jgi:hypothetical protein
MQTSDIASQSPTITHYELTACCDRLYQIARKLEHLAKSLESCKTDPQFQKLVKDLDEHLAFAAQVSSVLHTEGVRE